MVIRFSSSRTAIGRIRIGELEGYTVYWRPSDQTVWIASDTVMPTNYDNVIAQSEEEVMPAAATMLLRKKLFDAGKAQ